MPTSNSDLVAGALRCAGVFAVLVVWGVLLVRGAALVWGVLLVRGAALVRGVLLVREAVPAFGALAVVEKLSGWCALRRRSLAMPSSNRDLDFGLALEADFGEPLALEELLALGELLLDALAAGRELLLDALALGRELLLLDALALGRELLLDALALGRELLLDEAWALGAGREEPPPALAVFLPLPAAPPAAAASRIPPKAEDWVDRDDVGVTGATTAGPELSNPMPSHISRAPPTTVSG